MNIRAMLSCGTAVLLSSGIAAASDGFLDFDGITPRDANRALNLEDSTVQSLDLIELDSGELELNVMLGDSNSRIRFRGALQSHG